MSELVECKACDGTGKTEPQDAEVPGLTASPFISTRKMEALIEWSDRQHERADLITQGICIGCKGSGKHRI